AIAASQFVTCYQPQVAFATGEVLGVEALIGWQHPRDGLVPVERLLGGPQYAGVLNNLTRTMLPRTLEQAMQWRHLGEDFRIGVNLSIDDLSALDFPDFIVDAAASAHFPLSRLVLEISETRM